LTQKAINISLVRKLKGLKAFFACFLLLCSITSFAQTSKESNLKAEFLYNLTQFIDWPASAYSSPEAPFIVGVLAEEFLQSAISKTVLGLKVKGHPIVVEKYPTTKDIKNCHLLFISNTQLEEIKENLPPLPTKNVLTVSDMPDFAIYGGIIRLIKKQNRIKMQVNLPASKEADLNISSKLLQLAEVLR
jgi:hypothetical protein